MSVSVETSQTSSRSPRTLWSRLATSRLVRSAARAILVSFGVMMITFVLVRLIPGDPVQILLGENATAELVAHYREVLGLNGSLPQQFVVYLGKLAHGSLGTSIVTNQSVNSVIARTFPVTAWLVALTVVMALVLALPLGVLAAVHRRTWFGQVFRVGTSILLATPTFYSGLLLILFLAIRLHLAPVAGYQPGFPQNLRSLWLPALTLCTIQVPILARVLQSSITDTLEQEFVETAIVRGLPRAVFVIRYLLRPSLAPTVALIAYMMGQLLGSAVMVEIIFNLPGIGTALVMEGVLARDYPLVQGIVLVFGLVVVGFSFLSDTISEWLDPRTHLS